MFDRFACFTGFASRGLVKWLIESIGGQSFNTFKPFKSFDRLRLVGIG